MQDATCQTANSDRLYDLLEANDFAGLETLFQAFFASIPYEWYTNNAIAAYEGYYASVFYSYLAATGFDVTVEDSSSPRLRRADPSDRGGVQQGDAQRDGVRGGASLILGSYCPLHTEQLAVRRTRLTPRAVHGADSGALPTYLTSVSRRYEFS